MKTYNFYKCKSDGYSSFVKGQIYSKGAIGKYLQEYPQDWAKILDFPKPDELIECIKSGKNEKLIIKALKQWTMANIIIIKTNN